jgi:hypothetical protein
MRLALQAVRRSGDLGEAFQQIGIGASRITGSAGAAVALRRAGGFQVVANLGRATVARSESILHQLGHGRAFDGESTTIDDAVVAAFPTTTAPGVVLAVGADRDAGNVLALFAEAAAAYVDLHLLEKQAAAAAHRIQTGGDRLAALLASLRPGDALVMVAADALEQLHRSGNDAVQSVISALGVHLLNGTRPPGDAVLSRGDDGYLVVVRGLKAPVDTVVHRLLDAWNAARPAATLSIGAAQHLEGIAPYATLEQAETALASAKRNGGGQAHVAPTLRPTP